MKISYLLCLIALIALSLTTNAQRKMEPLGRGTTAIRQNSSSVFVNWRIFGHEINKNVSYNVYRDNTLIASDLVVSNFVDNTGSNGQYQVAAVVNDVEQPLSPAVNVYGSGVIEIPIHYRSQHYIHFAWPGDLDGDGEMELVIDRIPLTDGVNCYVEAYDMDGTRLWTIDMGPASQNMDRFVGGAASINNGQYDGVAVYDLDADGTAEVILQTANGTVFGDGATLSYPNNTLNFLSIIDGATGAEEARAPLPDDFINHGILQTQLSVGYFDGINPSVVVKGKTRASNGWFYSLVAAYDFDGSDAFLRWKNTNIPGPEFHQIRVADVDQDGKDEVCDGGYVLDDDGSLLYTMSDAGAVHGDRFHIGDFDPDRPGLEGYAIQQDNANGLAWYYYDAKDGSILQSQYLSHIGDYARGNVADLDPDHTGYEMWTFTDGLYNVQDGKVTSATPSSFPNFRLWWDGDVQSEMLDGVKFLNWNYSGNYEERILTASDWGAVDVWRAAPLLYGDLMGDWREEVVYEKGDRSSILVFTTDIPTNERIYTPLQNPEYRLCLTTKGYYQSAHVDYYLGFDMTTPPTPLVQHNEIIWKGGVSSNWNKTDNNWLTNNSPSAYSAGDSVLFGIEGMQSATVKIDETVDPGIINVLSPVDFRFEGAGELSGSGSLNKSGTSSLTIDIKASYTGKTSVEQGSLIINEELTNSQITVFGGATLGGNGIIAQNSSFEKRSVIAPGAPGETGVLNFNAGLTFVNGMVCAFDLTDDSTNLIKPGDKIITGGDVSIQNNLIFRINGIDGQIKPGLYSLISYNGEVQGNLMDIKVEGLFGKKFTLKDTLNSIALQIFGTRNPASIVWEGSDEYWDLQNRTNWLFDGFNTEFVAGDSVIFDQTGTSEAIVKVDGELPVGRLTVNGDDVLYRLTGNGNIGGEGDLIKNDKGTLQILMDNNTYKGKTVINGGTLTVQKLNIAGGSSSVGANPSVQPEEFEINNGVLSYLSAKDSYTDKGILLSSQSDTIDIKPYPTISVAGLLTGSGRLVKKGNGTLYILNNINTYTGGTIIEQGTIQLNDPGDGSNVRALGNGTITFKGGKLIMGNTRGYTDFNSNIHVPVGFEGTLEADIRCNYGGNLTGDGTLNVVLPGDIDRTIIRGDWSQFKGTVSVSGVGPMRLSGAAGYAKMTFDLAPGMSMYYSTGTTGGDNVAQTVHVGGISGAANSYLNGENWVIGEKNDTSVFDGVISGRSLTKEGTGMLVLNNASTYSGGTNVNEGLLYVNNNSGSATGSGTVNINSGGALDGTGIISGRVIVNSGGLLSPGGKYGTLTLNNSLVFQQGSSLHIELNNNNGSCDKLNVGDNAVALNGTLTMDNRSTINYKEGDSYQIFIGANISGNFESIEPATPGEGLVWDTSDLNDQGIIRVAKSTSVRYINDDRFDIYPNPVNGILNISNKSSEVVRSVRLKNLSGVIILNKVDSDISRIDLTGISSGAYLLEISTDERSFIFKVTKQ